MDKDFKKMTDFLVGMGIEQVPHTHKSYLAHLIAVYRDLETQGCPEDVCRAGMFHSIYGTEKFQGFTLPLERRGEVRALIGDRAERLAYLNCAMDRASFDRCLDQKVEPYRIIDRITGAAGRALAARLSTTSAASTSSTGWNRSLGRRSGIIAGPPTERWPSGSASPPSTHTSGLMAGTRPRQAEGPVGDHLALNP